jgi:hypothetical protein
VFVAILRVYSLGTRWCSVSLDRVKISRPLIGGSVSRYEGKGKFARGETPSSPVVCDIADLALMAIFSGLGSANEGPSSRGLQCFRASEDGIVSLGTKKFGTFISGPEIKTFPLECGTVSFGSRVFLGLGIIATLVFVASLFLEVSLKMAPLLWGQRISVL